MKKKFDSAKTFKDKSENSKQQLAMRKKESEQKKLLLSKKLMGTIDEYQKLGIVRSYQKMLSAQIEFLSQDIDAMQGEPGKETSLHGLQETKAKLEKMKGVAIEVENMPWQGLSYQEQIQWACNFLELQK